MQIQRFNTGIQAKYNFGPQKNSSYIGFKGETADAEKVFQEIAERSITDTYGDLCNAVKLAFTELMEQFNNKTTTKRNAFVETSFFKFKTAPEKHPITILHNPRRKHPYIELINESKSIMTPGDRTEKIIRYERDPKTREINKTIKTTELSDINKTRHQTYKQNKRTGIFECTQYVSKVEKLST